MDFTFRVNPSYALLHAFNASQRKEPFSGWYSFANSIWKRSPGMFYLLSGQPESCLYLQKGDICRASKKADELMREIRHSPLGRRLVRETERYRGVIQTQFDVNKDRALHIMEEMIGTELPRTSVTIFLTHPQLNNGMTVDDHTIAWGHPEEYLNYSTVYILHEVMHIITKHDDSLVMHAAIELLIDNELRIRLNGSGEYFEYPGHTELREIERALLPAWTTYLKKYKETFSNFVRRIKVRERRKRNITLRNQR